MISKPHAPKGLLARDIETERLRALLTAAVAGRGGALVVDGEPGIGKTALLRHAFDDAAGVQVLRTTGLEFEAGFSYAALHTLCAPLRQRLEGLPHPQREALRVMFGLADGDAPNCFLVGLAVLGLLSETAEEQPLLIIVDDAQWLDAASAQTLAFVAHRVDSERIAMIFALREPDSLPELEALPHLSLTGLPQDAARALLLSEFRAPLDERVRERILAEAQGNPLALPRTVGPGRVAGGFGLPLRCPCRDVSRRASSAGCGRCRNRPVACY
ncbi:AAA family ATPase [Streptomyces sp. NPDC001675]